MNRPQLNEMAGRYLGNWAVNDAKPYLRTTINIVGPIAGGLAGLLLAESVNAIDESKIVMTGLGGFFGSLYSQIISDFL